MNKMFRKHCVILQVIGVVLFFICYILTMLNVIDPYDKILNGITVFVSGVICLSYYFYIYYKFLYYNYQDESKIISQKSCIFSVVLYFVVCLSTIPLMLLFSGVHLSVGVMFAGAALTIAAKTVIIRLEQSERNRIGYVRNYTYIIYLLTVWKNVVFAGMFLLAVVNIFFPFLDYKP